MANDKPVPDEPMPPAIVQFASNLEKGTLSQQAIDGFAKFRENPAKCPPGSAVKKKADELWEKHLARKNAPAPAARPAQGRPQPAIPGGPRPNARGGRPAAGRNASAADPACLGEPFHNPYTFLPFPTEPPRRGAPTPLTVDELPHGRDRKTGTVELVVRTLSPLLTCETGGTSDLNRHRTYRVLALGSDAVVPATGVRGALRSLLTILTGGTLGYVDDEAWLCQGRDLPLGPRTERGNPRAPARCFLARVTEPGHRLRPGRVRLGRTELVRADDLQKALAAGGLGDLRDWRPQSGKPIKELWVDAACVKATRTRDDVHCWRVKLSGRPVNPRGKREGLFLEEDREILLPGELWSAYTGRNRHGEHSELHPGDLVWLEARDPNAVRIESAGDVVGIHWARWGRKGERLFDVIQTHHAEVLPDAFNPDGKVDEVTDLFGQVPRPDVATRGRAAGVSGKPAGPFSARVRPENLVFRDAVPRGVEPAVTLAPLAPPHPGCAAFYRDWDGSAAGLDRVSNHGKPLRGYKVYRTTRESGAQAPWRFTVQGVYDERGQVQANGRQRVNKTCDLLKPGLDGMLRIACRGLSKRELALLFAACAVDWRLGGGKPLGLGWCRVVSAKFVDEDDQVVWSIDRPGEEPASLPAELGSELTPKDLERMAAWQASQRPVAKLRYPRAVIENQNRKNRGGHAWFQRHAGPKKSADDVPVGLETLWVGGDLAQRAGGDQVRAQALPGFDPAKPQEGVLSGYDLFSGDSEEWRLKLLDKRTIHLRLEPFETQRHARPQDRSGGPQGQNQERRADDRRRGREQEP